MKFDMHCHTAEGSVDSKVTIEEYALILKNKGFDGMFVSDHDCLDGYRYWKTNGFLNPKLKDFVVLKGVEYDTIDAGHMLVIIPENVKLKILEIKGLPLHLLIDIVHKKGGIIGPAHPFGERYLSIFRTGVFKYSDSIANRFDFMEGYNPCEEDEDNLRARIIAKKYNLPVFGGRDGHKADCVGRGYTIVDAEIKDTNDFIDYIKSGKKIKCGGKRYFGTTKQNIGRANNLLVQGFWFYNKLGSAFHHRKRMIE